MTIFYTDADVSKGKLTVQAGSEDFNVNVTEQVNLFIRSGHNGVVQLGSANDIVQDYKSTGEVIIRMDGGNDQAFIGKGATGHIILVGGTGNDTLINASNAHVDFAYNFNAANQSNEGADGIKGFQIGTDHIVLNGITQTEFQNNFVVDNAPGSVGAVITDGNWATDHWSVQLIGVHETKAQLLADGAFVFT